MARRTSSWLIGCALIVSACSTDDGATPAAKPKQPPALACAEQPLELPRPPDGRLPCELMSPGFSP